MVLWQRWMVSYAVAYRDGLPNKIVFAGSRATNWITTCRSRGARAGNQNVHSPETPAPPRADVSGRRIRAHPSTGRSALSPQRRCRHLPDISFQIQAAM
jgi:hypothetical protein